MIIINSTNSDFSTNDIIDWLYYLEKPFIRINDDDLIEIKSISYEDEKIKIQFLINDKLIQLNEVSRYFYRRGFLNIIVSKIKNTISENVGSEFAYSYLKYLQNEELKLISLIQESIESQNGILSFGKANINKLLFLRACTLLEIKIPETAIIRSSSELKYYKKKWNNFITKPIDNGFFSTTKEWFYTFTNEICEIDIEELGKEFQPSLIQKKVAKIFEIRAFYFLGKIFSNAIFSQNDQQTSVDFRHYNRIRPNRNVPIDLPEVIKSKITLLMNYLKLETGSFDIIYSTQKEYIFLEVNPIGQFSQLSNPSNYYLEKFIAESL